MELPIYQVDAFASRVFAGNPAAVMPLEHWLADDVLQVMAAENNLSETAFFVPRDGAYELRWFTPSVEVDLCGHATLAAAHVLLEHLGHTDDEVCFHTRSGELRVRREGDVLTLDFPAIQLEPVAVDLEICRALGATASEAMLPQVNPHSVLYVYEFEQDVAGLKPDFAALRASSAHCVIATAPGDDCDFVSRFFGPQVGIDEDPVTGSAHCALVPYWARRLRQDSLQARQISARGGELACRLQEGRVLMSGRAVTYMCGTVYGNFALADSGHG